MKTLIINGSPRKNGDTTALIDELMRHLEGEVKVISCYDNISPCIDCRYCWENDGCALQDDMQAVYEYLTDCDNIVLASPIWFSSLSGPALNLGSRFQRYFTARFFRKQPSPLKPKKGLLLFVGGEPGTEEIPARNAITILRNANVIKSEISIVSSMLTDKLPARNDEKALEAIRKEAHRLNTPLKAE